MAGLQSNDTIKVSLLLEDIDHDAVMTQFAKEYPNEFKPR